MGYNKNPHRAGWGKTRTGSPFVISNSSTNNLRIPVSRADGKIIGHVANGKLIKHVVESKHMLIYPLGWAIDICALKQAQKLDAKWVLIIDRETGRRYRARITTFIEHGRTIDRGYGKQRLLELHYWEIKEPVINS